MNIGRGMNFLKLRKISSGIFAGAQGFWIVFGIVFFVFLIFLFVCMSPLSNQYAKTCKDIEDLLTALERYALKKDLYNESWIASIRQESDLYDKELGKCKSFLKERDGRLETIFSREDPGKGLMKIEDEVLWKNEYVKRVSELLTKLKANNIAVNESDLPFQNWGPDIPTWDTILPAQKRFWILEAIVNIALNNTGIIKLGKITFRESPYTYDPSFAELYTVIPVTIKVELEADRIQFLLHNILKSDIPFVIENIIALCADKVTNSGRLPENEGALNKDTNNHVSNPIIDITIDAYVIDYKA